MKLTIKIWSNNEKLIKEINKVYNSGLISFVEVYAVPETYKDSIKHLRNLNPEVIIHCPHLQSEFNIADKSLFKHNIEKFQEVKKFTDTLNSDTIIIHAGEDGQIPDAIEFLEKLNDNRIIIENMPRISLSNTNCIGYDKNTLEPFLKVSRGICLDFEHACKAAYSLNKEYKTVIRGLMELNPVMFHISDGISSNPGDEHLNIGEGNLDLRYFLSLVGEKPLVLETMRKNHTSLEEDIVNINKLLKISESGH
jgi:deoxyribonuclease-4